MAGAPLLAGAIAATVALGDELALALPAAFVAVTRTRTVLPTSPGASA
jgi:hypothetical protein